MLYANAGSTPRQPLEPGRHAASSAVWLDLLDPSEAERETAERLTGLTLPSRADLDEIESSSRLYTEGDALFFSMPFSFRDEAGHSSVLPVGYVLSERHLVTLRYAALPSFDAYAERVAHSSSLTAAEVFTGLVETVVDRLADVLERIGGELDAISRDTFRRDPGKMQNSRRTDLRLRASLQELGRIGDALSNLRDTVLGLGRIAAYAQQSPMPWLTPELKARLGTERGDIASLNDYEQQLNQKVSFLLDAVLGFINIEQNNIVKVLTVVSVVGIPPTFVVGLYGMNFKNMPEYDWAWGYQWGWAMILLSVAIPLIWIKVKGWA